MVLTTAYEHLRKAVLLPLGLKKVSSSLTLPIKRSGQTGKMSARPHVIQQLKTQQRRGAARRENLKEHSRTLSSGFTSHKGA